MSVALATYKGEKFVGRQLESLAWQSRLPDEVVVTDDRSPDGTVDVVRAFARTAPFPVRIEVNERNLNFRANFLSASALCTSDVILFCDQDDVWRPEKIATLARAFDEDPELLCAYHGATIVDAEENPLYPMFDAAEQHRLLSHDLPHPLFFVRGLVQGFRSELRAFDDLWPKSVDHFEAQPLGHDRWYILLALALGKVRFIEDDLLMYRQHGANVAGADANLSRLGRLLQRWPQTAESDVLRAIGARSRADVLRAMVARVPAEKRARLERFAAAYDDHADRLERRARTFSAPSLAGRTASLLRAFARGDYNGNLWRFDPRSIARDAAMGVLGIGQGKAQ